MKQCRFCDKEIPFYGDDECQECKEKDLHKYIAQNCGKHEDEKEVYHKQNRVIWGKNETKS